MIIIMIMAFKCYDDDNGDDDNDNDNHDDSHYHDYLFRHEKHLENLGI